MGPERRWFYYALGGGSGHLNRALCLARQGAKRGIRSTILTNSKFVETVRRSDLWKTELCDAAQIVELPGDTTPENIEGFVRNAITGVNLDALIVDTFPRGICGELVSLFDEECDYKWVLVARDITPEYLEKFSAAEFAEKHYSLIIAPGDHSYSYGFEPNARTSPWLTRDCDEVEHLLERRNDAGPFVVVYFGEKNEEVLIRNDVCRLINEHHPGIRVLLLKNTFPGMDSLVGAAAVISGAGYNIVAECRALNVPLIAIPQPRLYDRQQLRAELWADHTVNSAAEAVAILDTVLRSQVPPLLPCYVNGAAEAVALLTTG